jgi:Ca2+-binding EF-hand superfamily protein
MPMPVPVLILALAAQAAPANSQEPINVIAPQQQGRPFISPMGEPFRAGPGGDALAAWFHKADRNHDGLLTVDEMQADADRFFGILDLDHNGEIGPDEVERYESELAPEVHGEPSAIYDTRGTDNGSDSGSSASASIEPQDPNDEVPIPGGGVSGPQGAGGYSLINLPEPVTAADMDINRSITRDEFRRAAFQRFVLLDTNHSGRLTLAQLEAMRPSGSILTFHHHRGGRHHGG